MNNSNTGEFVDPRDTHRTGSRKSPKEFGPPSLCNPQEPRTHAALPANEDVLGTQKPRVLTRRHRHEALVLVAVENKAVGFSLGALCGASRRPHTVLMEARRSAPILRSRLAVGSQGLIKGRDELREAYGGLRQAEPARSSNRGGPAHRDLFRSMRSNDVANIMIVSSNRRRAIGLDLFHCKSARRVRRPPARGPRNRRSGAARVDAQPETI